MVGPVIEDSIRKKIQEDDEQQGFVQLAAMMGKGKIESKCSKFFFGFAFTFGWKFNEWDFWF